MASMRVTAHQRALLLCDPDLQQFGICLGMRGMSRSASRLLPLTPQVSQVGRGSGRAGAVTLPLDHAFGFELADVVREQSRCSASADALTVACFLDRDQEADLAMSDDQRRRS